MPVIGDIPLGQGNNLRIEDGQATISTEIGGAPVDVRIDGQGVSINGTDIANGAARGTEAARRALEDQRQTVQNAREATQRLETELRRRAEQVQSERPPPPARE